MVWTIIAEKFVNEEDLHYTGYGLRLDDYCISDISSIRDEVVRLADTFNSCGVSRVHAKDIVEDYLASV